MDVFNVHENVYAYNESDNRCYLATIIELETAQSFAKIKWVDDRVENVPFANVIKDIVPQSGQVNIDERVIALVTGGKHNQYCPGTVTDIVDEKKNPEWSTYRVRFDNGNRSDVTNGGLRLLSAKNERVINSSNEYQSYERKETIKEEKDELDNTDEDVAVSSLPGYIFDRLSVLCRPDDDIRKSLKDFKIRKLNLPVDSPPYTVTQVTLGCYTVCSGPNDIIFVLPNSEPCSKLKIICQDYCLTIQIDGFEMSYASGMCYYDHYIYLCASHENRILRLNPLSGISIRFAGSGQRGNCDGILADASLDNPTSICADSVGNFFFTEYDGHRVKKISTRGFIFGMAGTGENKVFGGSLKVASFSYPFGIFQKSDDVILVTDRHTIRRVALKAAAVRTIAGASEKGHVDGRASEARFDRPACMAELNGCLFVADRHGDRIRCISPDESRVFTIAGDGQHLSRDGVGLDSSFAYPVGLAATKGALWVVERSGKRQAALRRITIPEEIEPPPMSLFEACREGDLEAVKSLLANEEGRDINLADMRGYTPLIWSVKYGRTALVKEILSHDSVNINLADKEFGSNALHWALKSNNLEIIELLLSHCPVPNSDYVDKEGKTSLDLAEDSGQQQVLDSLIKSFRFESLQVVQFKSLSGLRQISAGRFTASFQADLELKTQSRTFHIPVICKIPKFGLGLEEWYEMEIMQILTDHPNTLPLQGVCPDFQHNKRCMALILPFKCGGSLATYVRSHQGDLPYIDIYKFCIEICRGVIHVHQSGYTHRDISLRNVYLHAPINSRFSSQRAVLGGFTLARPASQSNVTAHYLPWRWCAPEALRDMTLNRASDTWMLGVTMWELLHAGPNYKVPFDEMKTAEELLVLIEDVEEPVPLDFPDTCPDNFKRLIVKCCRYRPEKRISIRKLAERLQGLLNKEKDEVKRDISENGKISPFVEWRLPATQFYKSENLECDTDPKLGWTSDCVHGIGGWAQYKLSLPKGSYRVRARYCSLAECSMDITIDGEVSMKNVLNQATGGLSPEKSVWQTIGKFTLQSDKDVVLRLDPSEENGQWPYVNEFLFFPVDTEQKEDSAVALFGGSNNAEYVLRTDTGEEIATRLQEEMTEVMNVSKSFFGSIRGKKGLKSTMDKQIRNAVTRALSKSEAKSKEDDAPLDLSSTWSPGRQRKERRPLPKLSETSEMFNESHSGLQISREDTESQDDRKQENTVKRQQKMIDGLTTQLNRSRDRNSILESENRKLGTELDQYRKSGRSRSRPDNTIENDDHCCLIQ